MKSMRLQQQHRIKMVVVDGQSKMLEIRNFDLNYTMFSLPAKSDNGNSSKNQNKGFLKVNYFIKNMLDNSFVFTSEDLPIVEMFSSGFDNNFLVVPDVTDTTILEALHCKLNVLCGDGTVIDSLVLSDTDTGIGYEVFTDTETAYKLPSAAQWLGELSFWEKPWWERYDVTTFDNYAESAEDLADFRKSEAYNGALSVELDEIDQQVDQLFNQIHGKVGEVIDLEDLRRNSVKKNSWKPTVV